MPFQINDALKGISAPLFKNSFDPSISTYFFQDILSHLYDYTNKQAYATFLINHYTDKTLLWDLIVNNGDAIGLLGVLKNGNYGLFMDNALSVTPVSGTIAKALNAMEGYSVSAYLKQVNAYFGKSAMNEILANVGSSFHFVEQYSVQEHHIYGSSRLGIDRSNQVLKKRTYTISGYDSLNTCPPFGVRPIVNNMIDSFEFTQNSAYFVKVLTHKSYELTNHLGNVLATVLDRRSANNDSTVGSTITYYKADVVTATMYYPFGSSLLSYTYSISEGYRYGMNGQELDNEVSGEGNSYTAEFWQYDSRLGRRFLPCPVLSPHRLLAPT